MEIKVLQEKDIDDIKNVIEDDNMIFDKQNIKNFINSPNTYAFIAKNDEQVIGFAYGHGLARPDAKVMFYLHDIGILEAYQNKGTGTKFIQFIIDFAIQKCFTEVFLITDRNNPKACRVFEKCGMENDIPDEVCYVKEFWWNKIKNLTEFC